MDEYGDVEVTDEWRRGAENFSEIFTATYTDGDSTEEFTAYYRGTISGRQLYVVDGSPMMLDIGNDDVPDTEQVARCVVEKLWDG